MSNRTKKILLSLLAVLLLGAASRVQSVLNRDRDRLGLTRNAPLENAPPVLAFTTVALGGFRGLIANLLWIRANDLQMEDKFFEMAQLADWITKLEPHFVQVWLVQAWNMSFNISVKFSDPADRWRWVQRGIELLRDDGLRYNPNEPLIYRELSWHFQFKIGHNLDDAHMYYKKEWAREMTQVFGSGRPDFDALIHPQTDEQRERAKLLRDKYKMDPVFVKKVDERYGPLEWRLPEAHAIYWAALGLEKIQNSPRGNTDQLTALRRSIFQSMQVAFTRGHLIMNDIVPFDFGPNVEIVGKVNDAYLEMISEDPEMSENFKNAHRNFLLRAVYFLYLENRRTEAARWFKYLGEKYPDKPILDGKPDSLPRNLTLDEFAVDRVQEDVGETSHDHIKAAIEGFLLRYCYDLATDQDDQAIAAYRLAQQIHQRFVRETGNASEERLPLEPLNETRNEIIRRALSPENPWPEEAKNILRTKLNLPAGSLGPGTSTNNPPAAAKAQ